MSIIELSYVPQGMEVNMIYIKPGPKNRPERRYFVASPPYNPASLFDPSLRDGRRSVIHLVEGPLAEYQEARHIDPNKDYNHHQRAMKHAIRRCGTLIQFERHGALKKVQPI